MDADVIPTDTDLQRLAIEVGEQLKASRLMLVTAESCTGGWIAKMITDIPGCSDWFDCGVAAYSYEAKQALLGVRPETLVEHGAVSEERSEEHTSELQSLMRISYAVFCLKKKKRKTQHNNSYRNTRRPA